VNAYETALRLYREAAASRQDAQASGDAKAIADAQAELDKAGRVLQRWAIDPEYRGPRNLTGAAA
jgi:hypothetical protein